MFGLKIKKEWRAVSLLVGTTVGAGIFGLPYVFSRFGFLPSALYLVVLGGIMMLLNLCYGEIILRTPGDHQFPGYLRFYFPEEKNLLKLVNMFSLFLSLYGALLAYGIKIGEFVQLILGVGNPVLFSLLFFIASSLALYLGLRTVSSLELVLLLLMGFVVLLFLVISIPHLDFAYLKDVNPAFFFLPYGVILFALNGSSVIPEVEESIREVPGALKKVIIVGTLIPVFLYLVFTFVVVADSGPYTSEDALSGLLPILSPAIVKVGALFGILSMATSFLVLGYVLKEIWFRDFKVSRSSAFLFALLPSVLLFMFGARNFIKILDFSGAISVGLGAFLILAMHRKAKKEGKKEPAYEIRVPDFLRWMLYIVFLLGLFTPFLSLF